jgi:hypothetical protein
MGCHLWASLSLRLVLYYTNKSLSGVCVALAASV